jgi:hypothetical protein
MRFYTWSRSALTSGRSLASALYIYHHKQNMTAIVAVQPNVILGQQLLFAPATE